jgi:hypothetical protein
MPKVYIALFHIKLRHTLTHAQNTHTHVIDTGAVPIVQVVGEAGARKHFASLSEYVEWRMALEKKSAEGILVKFQIVYLSRLQVYSNVVLEKRLVCILVFMLNRRNLHVNVVRVCVGARARAHTRTRI